MNLIQFARFRGVQIEVGRERAGSQRRGGQPAAEECKATGEQGTAGDLAGGEQNAEDFRRLAGRSQPGGDDLLYQRLVGVQDGLLFGVDVHGGDILRLMHAGIALRGMRQLNEVNVQHHLAASVDQAA